MLPIVLSPLAETGLLLGLGARGTAALGPQISAPPPFDLFHDLRWISVYHPNWVAFGLELALVLCLRSAFAAWTVRAAWPSGAGPPALPAFVRALVFYAIAAILLAPWVVVMFGFAFIGLSWLFLVALPPVMGIALLIHRGALSSASGNLWDWRPRWSSVAWIAGSFLWLSAAGAVISDGPAVAGLAAAAGASLLNARAALSITAGIAQHGRARRKLGWGVPVALGGIFAVVVGGAALGFAGVEPPPGPALGSGVPARASGRPVIVVSGFNSRSVRTPAFPVPTGFVEWRYSYAGISPSGRLLPYGPGDTLQPVTLSAKRLGREVERLHSTYHRPVAIVAESEGALVARYYLTQIYHPRLHAVRSVALLDMPPVNGAIYYPARMETDGWGVASGWGLRGLTNLVQGLGPLRVTGGRADASPPRRLPGPSRAGDVGPSAAGCARGRVPRHGRRG